MVATVVVCLVALAGLVWGLFVRLRAVEKDVRGLRRDVGYLADMRAVEAKKVFGRRLRPPTKRNDTESPSMNS